MLEGQRHVHDLRRGVTNPRSETTISRSNDSPSRSLCAILSFRAFFLIDFLSSSIVLAPSFRTKQLLLTDSFSPRVSFLSFLSLSPPESYLDGTNSGRIVPFSQQEGIGFQRVSSSLLQMQGACVRYIRRPGNFAK